MQLYHYFRSSASYRVRIALALKGLDCELLPVHLLRDEQLADGYVALAPAKLVPLLVDGDTVISQSIAIIEYLDELHPTPSLLPGDAAARARIRALAQDVACEIHPLNNLRVLRYLAHDMKLGEGDKSRWIRHWIETGLAVIEKRLASPETGRYCHGDTPTLADCALVPQIHSAKRFDCGLDHVPVAMRVFDACMALPAFSTTQPSAYPESVG